MNELIAAELKRRLALWEEMKESFPRGGVPVKFVKEKGIYRGRAGTYVDKERTSQLTKHTSLPKEDKKAGITVCIRLVGENYKNHIHKNGAVFDYPSTERRGLQDEYKVQASKNALELGMPIFVVIGKRAERFVHDMLPTISVYTRVELATIIKYDDKRKSFEVGFIKDTSSPLFSNSLSLILPSAEEVDSFELDGSGETKIVSAKARLGQAEFRSSVMKGYGEKCAVCDMRHEKILDAAHIKPVSEGGGNNWRNGLVLCKNHHAAFDNNLFAIHPESKEFVFSSEKVEQELNFSQGKLITAEGEMPHEDALKWKWDRFQKNREES